MHTDLQIPAGLLLGFLLTLARMSGVFAFVPLPLKDAGFNISRIVLAGASTLALASRWPQLSVETLTISQALFFILSDAALGVAIGLLVSFLAEAFTVGAQIIALQAGFLYASVVDPTTDADSDVIAVVVQLLTGLLFFVSGIHRTVISIFAYSLDRFPPGSFSLTEGLAGSVIHVSAGIFSVGVRLALPLIALLLSVDLSLALIGKVTPQLTMSSNAVALKILLLLLTLSSLLLLLPQLYSGYAGTLLRLAKQSFTR